MKKQTYELQFDDHKRLSSLLGRKPNTLERVLALALWNEHCSYRSSRKHLKKFQFPTKRLISALGEQAGVIDLGQGERISFKMESHNHPSYLIPYHGAATGVGGILRDIFAMNARPIALADYLCFAGDFTDSEGKIKKEHKERVDQVVKGISDYGNCIGIPTLTGHTEFSHKYKGNILVNALALGYLDSKTKLMSSQAKGVGNYVVYVGSSTGRDGILGADMASQSFNEEAEASKPTVQIGDPFFGKQLMEACLESMKKDLVLACQDMGAAGLTCSSFEMSDKAGLGLSLHLDKVPLRDQSLRPEEILLSESQERMLFICEPSKYEELKKIFDFYQLEISILGKVLAHKEIELYWDNKLLLKVDPQLFTSNSPLEDRPYKQPIAVKQTSLENLELESSSMIKEFFLTRKNLENKTLTASESEEQDRNSQEQDRNSQEQDRNSQEQDRNSQEQDRNSQEQGRNSQEQDRNSQEQGRNSQEQGRNSETQNIEIEKQLLLKCLSSAQGRSREFIFKQYDQRVGTRTVKDSQFPLAVLRLPESQRELGISLGGRPYLMDFDTQQGAKDSIFYPALQLSLKGFEPLAVTDCLNFGNPEKESIMGEFVLTVEEIAKACRCLDTPIISGNVSFYNESEKGNITSSPAIGMIGLGFSNSIPDSGFKKEGEKVYLIHSHQFYFSGACSRILNPKNEKKLAHGGLQNDLVQKFIEQIKQLIKTDLLSSNRLVGKFGLAYNLARMVLKNEVGFSMDKSFFQNKPFSQNNSSAQSHSLSQNESSAQNNSSALFQERLYEVIISIEDQKSDALEKQLKKLNIPYLFLGTTHKPASLKLQSNHITIEELKKHYQKSWSDLSF